MADLIEEAPNGWADGVYRIERADPVLGGEDGQLNAAAKILGWRTRDLRAATQALVPDVRVFTANGVWNKPSHAVWVELIAVGSGGGGGGGSHGGGGGAGQVARIQMPAAALPDSLFAQPAAVGGWGAVGGSGSDGVDTFIRLNSGGSQPILVAGGGKGGSNSGTGGLNGEASATLGRGGNANNTGDNGGTGLGAAGGVGGVLIGPVLGGTGGNGFGAGGGGCGSFGVAGGGGGGGGYAGAPATPAGAGGNESEPPGAGAAGVVVIITWRSREG